MEKVVTVDYLLSLLKQLSEQGKGNMKIKCIDNELHEDEIGINYIRNEVLLRGYLFNYSPTKRVKDFRNDIEKAFRKYYGQPESEE